jgi:O-acetyl-ADP-ribose deacetylase (regulator of RNase III)
MRLIFEYGDLFDYPVIGHGCNCQGVMGAGVAGVVARRWPSIRDYDREHPGVPGGLAKFNTLSASGGPSTVYNLYTQLNPGANASLPLIRSALKLALTDNKNRLFAIPWIGCGIGGLQKHAVLEILEELAVDSSLTYASLTVVTQPGERIFT